MRKGEGEKQEDVFYCRVCGLKLPERQNTARNVLQRGREQEGGAGRQRSERS